MGREQRRAQQRAERQQQQRQQRPGRQAQRQGPQMSTSAPGDPPGRGSFFKPRWALDIISELKKVTWPSRREVANLTFVVIVVSLILGAFLGTADLGFGWVVEETILR
ncbi:MAG: preprotein translocase subunit SecE [Dehalococcoidia bacterium]